MKNTRPFEGIVSVNSSDQLSDQTRLSILSWISGPKRGKVADSMVWSFHVILVQEAELNFHGIGQQVRRSTRVPICSFCCQENTF